MDTVKLHYKKEYRMPPVCCACGEPAGPARFKVTGASWAGRHPYALEFPLCSACEQAYITLDGRRRAGCWISLGLSILLLIAGAVTGAAAQGNSAAGMASTVLLIASGAVFAGGLIAYQVLAWLAPRELRDPFRRLIHAVEIKRLVTPGFVGQGSVTLRFANESFAAKFEEANADLVMGSRK